MVDMTLEEARQAMKAATEGLPRTEPKPQIEDQPFEISFSTAKKGTTFRFKTPEEIFKLADAFEKLLDNLGIQYERIWKDEGTPL